MVSDPVAARYAQAAFEAAKEHGEVDETLRHLSAIGTLIQDSPELQQLIRNPDVDPGDKVGVLDRTLQHSWSKLVSAFVQMVVSMGRAEALPDIAEAFQVMVDVEQGTLRALVRSAHPLPETVLARVRTRLSHRGQKSIELTTEVVPELMGGLQVIMGHRVFDGSIRRQLQELYARLHTVRVY